LAEAEEDVKHSWVALTEPHFLEDVDIEAERARGLFPGQEQSLTLEQWLSILTEEVGEVARALNERTLGNLTGVAFLAQMRLELVQVGAMATLMSAALRYAGEAYP
jgi:NTP pyrophosphatase (non-canonical NTP hydrolase)